MGAICRRLDGIPLAIELAAARVEALTLVEILARLQDRFSLLIRGTRTAPPRQKTLRALIDWSFELLSAEERAFLRQLSVFAGGWDLEGAAAVAGAGGPLLEDETIDLLSSLTAKSLVFIESGPAGMRYHMLESVREYAREKLRQCGEEGAVQNRHAAYYLHLAEQAGPFLSTPEAAEWFTRLQIEHDNFRAALRWAQGAGDLPEMGIRLSLALEPFWDTQGHRREGFHALTTSAERAGASWPELRSRALCGAALQAIRMGDLDTAKELCRQALAASRPLDDKRTMALALRHLSLACYLGGDLDTATDHLTESIELSEQIEDRHAVIRGKSSLAAAAYNRGEFETARALSVEAFSAMLQYGDRRSAAQIGINVGMSRRGLKDLAGAHRAFTESQHLFAEVGDRGGVAYALMMQANLAADHGDFTGALALYENALNTARENSDRNTVVVASVSRGRTLWLMGREAEAAAALRRVLEMATGADSALELVLLAEVVAALLASNADPQAAVRLFAAADTLRRASGVTATWSVGEESAVVLSRLQEALAPALYAAAWEEGCIATVEELISEILARLE